jgi:hypothetical protein
MRSTPFIGLQFENLVLSSLDSVLERIGLRNVPVINAGPYSQKRTSRREGCQIDLLIRTKQGLYVVETKFRKAVTKSVISEVADKVRRLRLPSSISVRTVLIHLGELDPEILASDYFDHIIPAADLLR